MNTIPKVFEVAAMDMGRATATGAVDAVVFKAVVDKLLPGG